MDLLTESLAIVIAAAIAALASLIVVIVSKEQKVSEFRQHWIDSLRSDASELLAELAAAKAHLRLIKGPRSEAFQEFKGPLTKVEMLSIRIALRLNAKEPDHIALAEHIDQLISELKNVDAQGIDVDKTVVPALKKILKTEWQRVKKGELIHRCAMWAAALILGIAIAFAVALGVQQWNTPAASNTTQLETGKPAKAGP